MARACFDDMDDDRVLAGVEVLVRRSNEITAELLAYLAEVEARGLHLREACSCLFVFCVERLHMSEGAAGKRIWAARTARRFPLVLEMIARGEIHLTGVNLLAPHLTEENHVELLGRARHRSKRDIEKVVAEIAPRPDVPSRVVALPHRAPSGSPVVAVPAAADQMVGTPPSELEAVEAQPAAVEAQGEAVAAQLAVVVPRPLVVAPRPSVVAPLSARRYEIRVTIDEETHAKLTQLQGLLAHSTGRDPAAIVSRAIDHLLAETLARKAALTRRPRAGKPAEKRSRYIPAGVRRAVWKRDGGQCAFVDKKGRRCGHSAPPCRQSFAAAVAGACSASGGEAWTGAVTDRVTAAGAG